MLNWIVWNRTVYMNKNSFGFNNLQWLICHQTKPFYFYIHSYPHFWWGHFFFLISFSEDMDRKQQPEVNAITVIHCAFLWKLSPLLLNQRLMVDVQGILILVMHQTAITKLLGVPKTKMVYYLNSQYQVLFI